MNIFVGSLPFKIQEADLKELFEAFGEVNSVKIINDRETGRSKGHLWYGGVAWLEWLTADFRFLRKRRAPGGKFCWGAQSGSVRRSDSLAAQFRIELAPQKLAAALS